MSVGLVRPGDGHLGLHSTWIRHDGFAHLFEVVIIILYRSMAYIVCTCVYKYKTHTYLIVLGSTWA